MILIYICYKICFVHNFSQCMSLLHFYFKSLLFPYYTIIIFSLSHFLPPKPYFLSYPQPLFIINCLYICICISKYIITTCSICIMFLYVCIDPSVSDRHCFAPPWERLCLLLSASSVACSCLLVLRSLEFPTLYDRMSVDVLIQLMCRQSCW